MSGDLPASEQGTKATPLCAVGDGTRTSRILTSFDTIIFLFMGL